MYITLLLKEAVEVDYDLPHQLVDLEFWGYLYYAGGFLLLLLPLTVDEEIAKLE